MKISCYLKFAIAKINELENRLDEDQIVFAENAKLNISRALDDLEGLAK